MNSKWSTRMFHPTYDVIHERTLWSQEVVLNFSLQKQCTKLDDLPHVFPRMEFILHFV